MHVILLCYVYVLDDFQACEDLTITSATDVEEEEVRRKGKSKRLDGFLGTKSQFMK